LIRLIAISYNMFITNRTHHYKHRQIYMKDNFISKFIGAFIETGKDLHEIWQWQPLYYKGWKVNRPGRGKIYEDFRNLKSRGLVSKMSGDKYKFTKNGIVWFKESRFKYFKLKVGKWDKKWRVVIFDIPQEMHGKRNWLRKKLINLGFYMVQKSVFTFPYSCEEELGDICSYLDISDYVDILIASSIGFREQEIKKFFQFK